MTRPEDPVGDLPPADELDELASALLDGDATAAEALRAAEPEVQAEVARRRARFERVRDVVAAPVPVDPDAREAAIDAAMAAAAVGAGAASDPARPDELHDRRADRARRRSGGLRVVGVAAAVLAAVALGTAVLDDDGSDVEASGGDAATEEAEALDDAADSPGAVTPEGGDQDGSGSNGFFMLGDLGDFADVDALLAAAPTTSEAGLEGGIESDVGGEAAARSQCGRVAAASSALATPIATATVAGEPVEVWVEADGATVVVDPASCVVVGRAAP